MSATVMYGAGDVRVATVPDPILRERTDAIVRVTRSCARPSRELSGGRAQGGGAPRRRPHGPAPRRAAHGHARHHPARPTLQVDLPTPEFFDAPGLLAALAFPGLVSMQAYRAILPARVVDWKDGIRAALFYSVVNCSLGFWALLYVVDARHLDAHPGRYGSAPSTGSPFARPLLYRWLVTKTPLRRWLLAPYPTAFDCFFGQKLPCFVIVNLKGGGRIAGLWGPSGYASSFAEQRVRDRLAAERRGGDKCGGERIALAVITAL